MIYDLISAIFAFLAGWGIAQCLGHLDLLNFILEM